MRDLRQTAEFANFLKNVGWNSDNIEQTFVYSRKILGFSVTKIQRPLRIPYQSSLENLYKKNRSIVIYAEPIDTKQLLEFSKMGFLPYHQPFLPSKTVQIDIAKTEKDLLSQMHSKTRYNIGLSNRKDVSIQDDDDILFFADAWKKAAKERGMFLSQTKEIINLYHSFGQRAHLHMAYCKESIVGGVLTLATDEILYYMYAYSTPLGKKLFAPSLLVWDCLKYGKKKHLKLFDFEGILDVRAPLKDWKGFTRFKRSFGGDEIEYPLPLRLMRFPF